MTLRACRRPRVRGFIALTGALLAGEAKGTGESPRGTPAHPRLPGLRADELAG